jgi:hypothetical protein
MAASKKRREQARKEGCRAPVRRISNPWEI